MIRIIGVLLALAGLILVGLSGDNKRSAPNGMRLTAGMLMITAGILIALFAGQVEMMMGWQHP